MSRVRVLLVDDDPAVLGAVNAALGPEGYEVEWASDGAAALRAALDAPPALMVVDVGMPRIDGWELCEILRRQSHTRDVPVLFLTGHSALRDRITALQVGGTDFLTKPFRAEELRAKVRALSPRRPGSVERR